MKADENKHRNLICDPVRMREILTFINLSSKAMMCITCANARILEHEAHSEKSS